MRVIAGTARGRRLAAPEGPRTRPTPDRVREALFSILTARIPQARVLDLFAGTGAFGIEALSRGATHATFVESGRAALVALRQNLELVAGADTRLVTRPLPGALDELAIAGGNAGPYDLIFMDPPYEAGLLEPTLARIAALDLSAPNGIVICEHRGGTETERAVPLPPAPLTVQETRSWGDVAVTFIATNENGPVPDNREENEKEPPPRAVPA